MLQPGLRSGRVAFGEMDAVVFGRPAADAVAEEARRLDAERVFLMVSGTLNRTTDEIAKVRQALGNRFAGIFDRMPPHTPRRVVIEAAAAAREAGADLIATIGGGSVTDGAKAVQLCLANDIRSEEHTSELQSLAYLVCRLLLEKKKKNKKTIQTYKKKQKKKQKNKK